MYDIVKLKKTSFTLKFMWPRFLLNCKSLVKQTLRSTLGYSTQISLLFPALTNLNFRRCFGKRTPRNTYNDNIPEGIQSVSNLFNLRKRKEENIKDIQTLTFTIFIHSLLLTMTCAQCRS